jgi:hypothetical protein
MLESGDNNGQKSSYASYSQRVIGAVQTKVINELYDGSVLSLDVELIVDRDNVYELSKQLYSNTELKVELSASKDKLNKMVGLLELENQARMQLNNENTVLKRDLTRLKKRITYIETSYQELEVLEQVLRESEYELDRIHNNVRKRLAAEQRLAMRTVKAAKRAFISDISIESISS